MTEGEKHFIGVKCKGQVVKGALRVGVQDDRVWSCKRRGEEHLENENFSSKNSNCREL